jgi:hypothetical protein
MDNDKLFEVLVHGFVGSWSAGINAYVDERKPISYGVQCVVKSLDDSVRDTVQVNVYKSKKAVRIVIQGKDSELLELAKKAMPVGEITEEVLANHRCIYI